MRKAHFGGWSICAKSLTMLALLIAVGPVVPVRADLQEMPAAQMAQITGTGFSSFLVEGNRVRADFNIAAETYTEIGSLKLGYWDDGLGPGWDQNWTAVKLGTLEQDMSLRGFFIEAYFDNLTDPVNRRLTSVFFGFSQVTGDLQADFQSLSRVGVGGDPDQSRVNLGVNTFHFNNSELMISLQLQGGNRGIWVRFGEGTTLN
ncbi:MAG: hypothetical protein C4519_06695 [Desulfobacteraceae bacterium]|nr:MAG: hypothetical protein C4519_06695 [Desulfobacteraceae bacterium]